LDNKVFDIIDARCNHEDYGLFVELSVTQTIQHPQTRRFVKNKLKTCLSAVVVITNCPRVWLLWGKPRKKTDSWTPRTDL